MYLGDARGGFVLPEFSAIPRAAEAAEEVMPSWPTWMATAETIVSAFADEPRAGMHHWWRHHGLGRPMWAASGLSLNRRK